jgi:hypothetical protein
MVLAEACVLEGALKRSLLLTLAEAEISCPTDGVHLRAA